MPDFALSSGGGYSLGVGAAIVAVANASANTKGSWVGVVASTSFEADALLVGMAQAGNTLTHLVDFAVGGSGSEQIIAADILHGGHGRMMTWAQLPVSIPAGSRIAARCQASTGSAQVQVRVVLIRQGLLGIPAGGRVATLGANTADSGGTQIDPGAVGNTYGSWVEISASTPDDIAALLPRIGNIANSAPTDSAANYYYDIGIGGAGSEVAIVDGFPFSVSSNGSYGGGGPPIWLPVSIPAGSRIAARAKANVTDATDRLFDLSLLALIL